MKYIIVEMTNPQTGVKKEIPVIFGEDLVHREMAEAVGRHIRRELKCAPKTVSAGFVHQNLRTGDLFCRGRSESLNMASRDEDTYLLARTIGS